MNITIAIVAYNEERYLPGLLDDIMRQTFPHDQIEILLIDSMSCDDTAKEMVDFSLDHGDEFYQVVLLKNKKRILAAGCNEAIRYFSTDALIRIDAHAHIPVDFVEKNVRLMLKGEMVTGGVRPTIVQRNDPWSRTLRMAEESMFGSSIAGIRRKTDKNTDIRYVKSIFHGAYRREVIEDVGFYNETLGRTEDNEYNYRVRKKGYKIALSPDIISYQYVRPTFSGMVKQKGANGYWVGKTLGVAPSCLSPYHLVPAGFVLGIIYTAVQRVRGHKVLFRLMWGVYAILSVVMSLVAASKAGSRGEKFHPIVSTLPFIFPLLHIAYGVGTLAGIATIPFMWIKKCLHKGYKKSR